jgi:hypothetical protein
MGMSRRERWQWVVRALALGGVRQLSFSDNNTSYAVGGFSVNSSLRAEALAISSRQKIGPMLPNLPSVGVQPQ